MPSNLPYKQAANVERRTWDKETYEARAKARIAAENSSDAHKGSDQKQTTDHESRSVEKEEFQNADSGARGPMNSKRAFLKARRGKVDLESKLGTSEIINPDAAAVSSSATDNFASVNITDGVTKTIGGVGWQCKVCDCFLKDSLTYLDHINGRKHQRTLGFSMRIAKSTTKEVVSKLDQLAQEQKSDEAKKSMNGGKDSADTNVNEFEDAVRKKDEEIEQRKAERKRRREERKKRIREEVEQKEPQTVGVEEDQEEGGVDPDMAAMMGFSGFG